MFISKGGFILVFFWCSNKFLQTQWPITTPIFFIYWFIRSEIQGVKLVFLFQVLKDPNKGNHRSWFSTKGWGKYHYQGNSGCQPNLVFCCRTKVPVSLLAICWRQFFPPEVLISVFSKSPLQQQGVELFYASDSLTYSCAVSL